MCFSHKVSSTAQRGTSIGNVSDLFSDVISGPKPRDVSLLYASDRKLFNVTSLSGDIIVNEDPPHVSAIHSLALLVEYAHELSLVFLVCLKMATEAGTRLTPPPTSSHREITVQVSENVPVGTVLILSLIHI